VPLERAEALRRLGQARVGHLATVGEDGAPHIVPVTLAATDEMIVTMIDQKPKTTTTLKRLDNIEANPRVSVLVDAWSEDWSELWWVRVDGTAKTHDSGDLWEVARSLLVAKYPQYRQDPPRGPAIVITVDTVRFWEGTQ